MAIDETAETIGAKRSRPAARQKTPKPQAATRVAIHRRGIEPSLASQEHSADPSVHTCQPLASLDCEPYRSMHRYAKAKASSMSESMAEKLETARCVLGLRLLRILVVLAADDEHDRADEHAQMATVIMQLSLLIV